MVVLSPLKRYCDHSRLHDKIRGNAQTSEIESKIPEKWGGRGVPWDEKRNDDDSINVLKTKSDEYDDLHFNFENVNIDDTE